MGESNEPQLPQSDAVCPEVGASQLYIRSGSPYGACGSRSLTVPISEPVNPTALDAASLPRPICPCPSPSPLTSPVPSTPSAQFDANSGPHSSSSFSADVTPSFDDHSVPDKPDAHAPALISAPQLSSGAPFAEAAKRRTTHVPARDLAQSAAYKPPTSPTCHTPPVRGSSKPAASPDVTHASISLLALQAQHDLVQRVSESAPSQGSVKRALLVGLRSRDTHDTVMTP